MLRLIAATVGFVALSTLPGFALTEPPSEPSYDRPSFDRTPEPPSHNANPPEPPSHGGNDPRKPPRKVSVPPEEHVVVCEVENHELVVRFTRNVEPRFYKEGIKFCKKQHPIQPAKLRCVNDDGDRKILASKNSSSYAQRQANRFCMCVWGLD